MSRIRGIEVKVQKEILQTRKYGLNEILRKKTEEPSESKDDVERNQIVELLNKLPKLDKIFEVHRKIGEGTFSSVYLGSLRKHAALPGSQRRWFAIKHLVPTAHPARVEHELRCLQDMGGKHNVIGVDLCLRHLDTIVFIMPYIPHGKFSEYVHDMDAEELRAYMRALVTALRHVHSFGVIHRDVKPSNFLYDRKNRRYLLVDFGLAQRLVPPPTPDAPPPPPPAHANSRKRTREETESPPDAKRVALDLSVSSRTRAAAAPTASAAPAAPPEDMLAKSDVAAGRGRVRGRGACGCACASLAALCGACLARPAARAARAGTQGYRPPEVLLKVSGQSTPVDMWACGVVLGSVLTARYPLLRAPDDAAALAELCDLLGTRAVTRAAASLGRRLVVPPQGARAGLCLRRLAARLRGAAPPDPPRPRPCMRCRLPAFHCVCRLDGDDPERMSAGVIVAGFPDSAFSLLARLLAPDPARRASADEALRHPFLTGADADADAGTDAPT